MNTEVAGGSRSLKSLTGLIQRRAACCWCSTRALASAGPTSVGVVIVVRVAGARALAALCRCS